VQTFPTSDGWLFIMCMTDKFWTTLAERIGRPELADDARFSTQAARQANRDALTQVIDEALRRESTSYWLDRLNGHVPVAPVLDLAKALDSPFLRRTDMIREVAHPAAPQLRVLANPIKIDGQRLEQRPCSPYGADNEAYLSRNPSTDRAKSS
jgi:crotonobetainyl-CoA:carnitine CoA-transferase CaiB-like acyl-CoA transferase